MSRPLALSLVLVAAGCGAAPVDEVAADVSSATLAGNWQLAGDATDAGDVVYLYVTGGGAFGWTRCYDSGCAAPVVEDGSVRASSSSGKRYLTFTQLGALGDDAQHFNAMYQYTLTAKTLRLRKTYTSRWITLTRVSDAALCAQSGGRWSGGACDCGASWPTVFSPAAGGCWASPAAGEEACDDTQGRWTDDDADAAGTYCDCGFARVLTDAGCVAR